MPNWCYNNVKIESYGHPSLSKDMKNSLSEDKDLFIQFVPQPKFENDQDWYMWNVNNWGTKWDVTTNSVQFIGDDLEFSFDSAWAPPIQFYEHLQELGFLVDAKYYEPGMCFVGAYYDGSDECYDYSGMNSEEVAEALPYDLDEFFQISNDMAMYEEENEGEE